MLGYERWPVHPLTFLLFYDVVTWTFEVRIPDSLLAHLVIQMCLIHRQDAGTYVSLVFFLWNWVILLPWLLTAGWRQKWKLNAVLKKCCSWYMYTQWLRKSWCLPDFCLIVYMVLLLQSFFMCFFVDTIYVLQKPRHFIFKTFTPTPLFFFIKKINCFGTQKFM